MLYSSTHMRTETCLSSLCPLFEVSSNALQRVFLCASACLTLCVRMCARACACAFYSVLTVSVNSMYLSKTFTLLYSMKIHPNTSSLHTKKWLEAEVMLCWTPCVVSPLFNWVFIHLCWITVCLQSFSFTM